MLTPLANVSIILAFSFSSLSALDVDKVKSWLDEEVFVTEKGWICDDKVKIDKRDIFDLIVLKETTNKSRYTENISTALVSFRYKHANSEFKCIGAITYTWNIAFGNWSGEKIISMATMQSKIK